MRVLLFFVLIITFIKTYGQADSGETYNFVDSLGRKQGEWKYSPMEDSSYLFMGDVVCFYFNDTLNGSYSIYQKGRLVQKEFYSAGLLDGTQSFYHKKKLIRENHYRDGVLLMSVYYKKGKFKHKEVFQDGKKNIIPTTSKVSFISKKGIISDSLIAGNGVRVGPTSYYGSFVSIGAFDSVPEEIGITSGIIMSSGAVDDVFHKNMHPGRSTGTRHYPGNYPKKGKRKRLRGLKKVASRRIYDPAVLEFEFIAYYDSIEFTIVFGSEEYPEYAPSGFNDAFAFFITGGGHKNYNIAKLPNSTPITINRIHPNKNNDYYVDNNPYFNFGVAKGGLMPRLSFWTRLKLKIMYVFLSKEKKQQYAKGYWIDEKKLGQIDTVRSASIEFDGLTKRIVIGHKVEPYKKYKLSIGICDAGDNIFDSAILIEKHSFKGHATKDFTKQDTLTELQIDTLLGLVEYDTIPDIEDTIVEPVVQKKKVVQKKIIHFKSGKIDFAQSLDQLVSKIIGKDSLKISIVGYTDDVGDTDKNAEISQGRARKKRDYLIKKGIKPEVIKTNGRGEDKPIGDNSTEEGRKANRRVEIFVKYYE